jgi:hypothetical protein
MPLLRVEAPTDGKMHGEIMKARQCNRCEASHRAREDVSTAFHDTAHQRPRPDTGAKDCAKSYAGVRAR